MTDHLADIAGAVEHLHAAELAVEQARHARDEALRAARAERHTWQAIADAAGMTPHGVRYALGRRTGPHPT